MTTDNDQDIRNLFDTASRNVSLNTHYRLEQAVHAAIRAPDVMAPVSKTRRGWLWGVGASAVMASVALVAVLVVPRLHVDVVPVNAVAKTSPVPATSGELVEGSTAWDEDPAFYAWLSSPEAKSLVATK